MREGVLAIESLLVVRTDVMGCRVHYCTVAQRVDGKLCLSTAVLLGSLEHLGMASAFEQEAIGILGTGFQSESGLGVELIDYADPECSPTYDVAAFDGFGILDHSAPELPEEAKRLRLLAPGSEFYRLGTTGRVDARLAKATERILGPVAKAREACVLLCRDQPTQPAAWIFVPNRAEAFSFPLDEPSPGSS